MFTTCVRFVQCATHHRRLARWVVLISSCGRRSCPGVCARVCHCPAGLARSREQFAMYRNRRLALRFGLRPAGGPPRQRWEDVEFLPPVKHDFGALNSLRPAHHVKSPNLEPGRNQVTKGLEPGRIRRTYPTHDWDIQKPFFRPFMFF